MPLGIAVRKVNIRVEQNFGELLLTNDHTVDSTPNSAFSQIRILLTHLRLHFQVLLAPIFLWGFLLADGAPTGQFAIAFVALHLFLYGGTTAFNSYYDRDQGPVGGLEHPPPVTQQLLPFSLIMQGIGFLLACFVNLPFAIIYILTFVVATAYSHPRTRLKRRPLLSLLVVGVGQGGVIALAGWVTARPNLGELTPLAGVGILAATLMIAGIYPVTQIYQIEEDLARGDVTFAAWVGPQRALWFSTHAQACGAGLLIWLIWRMFGAAQATVVALAYAITLAILLQWSFTFDATAIIANYRRVMRITLATSFGFLGFLTLHLLGLL
jgi:1,4-dihydroxy-2-naphthoate octaprenyltransferase